MKEHESAVKHIIERADKLLSDRRLYDKVLQDISNMVIPNRGDFIETKYKAARRDVNIYDDTAVHANQALAATIHSGLTNPSTKWAKLKPSSLDLRADEEVARYLEEVEDILFSVFSAPDLGFSQKNHQLLLDLCAYGTAALYVAKEPGKDVNFQVMHLSQIIFDENNEGIVDVVFRNFKWTARKIVQQWPGIEDTNKEIKTALMQDPVKEFEIMHAVMPIEEYNRIKPSNTINKEFEVASVYILKEDKEILAEGGFHGMPYLVVRWEQVTGEILGRSPGWNALASINMANSMQETLIRGAQMSMSPPNMVADDGVIFPLQMRPNGMIMGGLDETGRPRIQPYLTGANYPITFEMIEQTRDSIRKAFFVDLFEDPKGQQPRTATEINERRETRLRLTGPQIKRIEDEYLTRLIQRVVNILDRSGELPEPPQQLEDQNIEVEYISPLANTQRAQENLSYQRFVSAFGPFLEAKPELLDIINFDVAVRDVAVNAGIPLRALKSQEQIDKERQAVAEQQQALMQLEATTQLSNSAATLHKAGIPVTD